MIPRYPDMEKRVALYPGSFNPFTIGHLSILERGLRLFDKVVVVIGCNGAKDSSRTSADELRSKLAHLTGVEVMEWDGLTVDAATKVGAGWLLRGVRSVADYEYERNLADINRELTGIETVLLTAEPKLAMVSSSMVRELRHFGHDVSDYIV